MDPFLKIGITCYPSLGGSGVVATELGKLLAEKGHEVHFISHSVPFRLGGYHKNIFYHEVEVSDYYVFRYPPYDLSLATKMAQVAKTQGLDVLHVHYAVPHAVCAFLAKQMIGDSLKVVTTLHGTDITVLAQDESLKDLIRLAINESDAVTSVSLDLTRETREVLDITRDIDLTYNFVDERVYYPRDAAGCRADFAEPGEQVLMHISNFRPVKRVADVVDIFHRVNEEVPSKLLLVGEGPDLPKIRTENQRVGAKRPGAFSRQAGRYRTRHFDGRYFAAAIGEGKLRPGRFGGDGLRRADGRNDCRGHPGFVKHGETGFLAPIGDTKRMAEYCLTLLKSPASGQRCGKPA